MFKPKFFSILFIFLMVFSTVGNVSATVVRDNVNDGHVIVVDNPTVSKIQKAIDNANDKDTILIKGSATDTGNINCNKILTIKGEDCIFNKIHWECNNLVDFENITFENCKSDYGGAIKSKNSIKLNNCNFTGNSANTDGGAVWAKKEVIVNNCSFNKNKCYGDNIGQCEGGAIYSDDCVTVSGSNFTVNVARDYGGAIYSRINLVVDVSSFMNNYAYGNDGNGGAVYSDGGGVKLIGSNFTSNFAYDYGGAVWSDDGVTVESSRFVNNSVTDNRGGAIYMDDSYDLKVSNSGFYGNHANDKGGAIYCEGNFAHVYLNSFNSFENNVAKEGSAVFTDGYFDAIWQNWWGTMKPNWDSGLLVEWKAIGPNKKHEDDRPLSYDPNL